MAARQGALASLAGRSLGVRSAGADRGTRRYSRLRGLTLPAAGYITNCRRRFWTCSAPGVSREWIDVSESVDSESVDRMRDALLRALPGEAWVLADFVDDMPCLILRDDRWVGGFYERGNFNVRFETRSFIEALDVFTKWVRSMDESTRLSADATARWRARMGKNRP
jgi:hypothetical protein